MVEIKMMMLAFLAMAAVAFALPPQDEALLAKPAGENQAEVRSIRERRNGKFFFPPHAHTHTHAHAHARARARTYAYTRMIRSRHQ